MSIWHILFPLFVVAPVAINARAMRIDPRHGDAFGIAMLIMAIWVGQMSLGFFLGIPQRAGYNALFDSVAALAVLGSWVTAKTRWKLALLGLYLVQIYLSAAFWFGWEVLDRLIKYGFYVRANNVVWLLELVLVSATGGLSVVRHTLHDLRHRDNPDRAMGAPA